MKKIYRVWEEDSYGKYECAFLASFKAACDYIKAQLKDEKEIGGYKSFHQMRYTDEAAFIKSLKEGYRWGGIYSNHILKSYYIEIITLEG